MSAGSTITAPRRSQRGDRLLGQAIGGLAVAEELLPGHADARAGQGPARSRNGV